MNTKQKHNWWIDLLLFISFIFTFFLDFTGLELHQWIGIFCGALATYHLLLHRAWVNTVGGRFFRSTSGRARLYYILNILLFAGFTLLLGKVRWHQISSQASYPS